MYKEGKEMINETERRITKICGENDLIKTYVKFKQKEM